MLGLVKFEELVVRSLWLVVVLVLLERLGGVERQQRLLLVVVEEESLLLEWPELMPAGLRLKLAQKSN